MWTQGMYDGIVVMFWIALAFVFCLGLGTGYLLWG